ncbi:hypothetical protein [Alkalitalea saponilacus]|uniref:Uncharacterized protein n=1 Tax=Alkalitalea saponilacus TaxID=889453 RepID=A0A1T5G413_9BACT|nr:hypothetical protein [Alkalitalea saponilacus]ASB47847.1 hypothetical protein CDL62_01120 [Alkalitalea saponilacus]SKC03127.1 hypothetical protein SAMN03080601_01720 [Alkalitalea saponilacus]
MSFILKAKAWHIFIATFIIPFFILISGFVVPSYYISTSYHFFSIPGSIVVSQLFFYLWLWAVGSKLHKRHNLNDFFNNRLFKSLIIIPVLVIIIILGYWIWGASILSMGKFSMANVLFSALWIIMPIQFTLIISKFYCFFFAAKVIKSSELNKNVEFDEFITEFILIIVFPVGIWYLQPRINKLLT